MVTSPGWLVNEPSDFDNLNEQLAFQVDYLDFYLLHSINKVMDQTEDLGVRSGQAIASGRFRHLGFSFHGGRVRADSQ